MIKIKSIASIVFTFLTVNTFAQGEFGTDAYSVGAGRYIERARKINEQPKIADTSIAVPPMVYNNLPGRAEVKYSPENIDPAKLKIQPTLDKLYKFYAKAGVGMYTSPLAEIYFNDGYNKKGTYGLHAKHFSSQGSDKQKSYNGFSDNEIDGYGKIFINKFEIGGSAEYKRNVVYYYGRNPDTTDIARDSIRQRFNYISGKAYIGTFYPDSDKINHREDLRYYYFDDVLGAVEHNVLATSAISKRINKEIFGGDIAFDFNSFSPTATFPGCLNCFDLGQTAAAQNNALIRLNPHVMTNTGDLHIKVGLSIWADIDKVDGKFRFYPDLEARYSLFNDVFVPYIGITGKTVRNSYRSLTNENPFVMSLMELRNTNQKFRIYGGFRGTISSTISFNAKADYLIAKDLPLFVTDTVYSNENRFAVIYDDIDVLSLSGQIMWQKSEKLKLLMRGEFFSYSTGNEWKAWGMPGFNVTSGFIYDMFDKIMVRADLFVVGKRFARSLSPVDGVTVDHGVYPVELKPYVDFNLGVEYRYTKRLSAFINFNNIVSKKYQYWYNYPVQGINILGGVTYSF